MWEQVIEFTKVNKAGNLNEANNVIHVKKVREVLRGNNKTVIEEVRSSPEDDLVQLSGEGGEKDGQSGHQASNDGRKASGLPAAECHHQR